jgi:hypothetical protein
VNQTRYFFIIGFLLLILMACTPGAGSPIVTARPTATPPVPIIANEAMVDKIELIGTSALPVRMFVQIEGNLPNGCVTLKETGVSREAETFTLNLITERDTLALCTEALVPFSEQIELDVTELDPAVTYTVNVINRDGSPLTGTFGLPNLDTTTSGEGVSELPASCFPTNEQNGPFINVADGYCLQYPVSEGFAVHDIFPFGVATIWGAPLTPTFEPIRSGLSIHKREEANGRSLDDIIAEILAANPGAMVTDNNAVFAGEPAQVVEGIDGMMDSRRYYLLHDNFVYEITLVPLTDGTQWAEQVMAQRDSLWQTVNDTFTWLPSEVTAQFDACLTADASTSPYFNLPGRYCLLYPSYFGQRDHFPQSSAIFSGPALDPTIPEPVRVTMMVRTEAANGRSLSQVITDLIASYNNDSMEIEQSETTLGGEPALLIKGLLGREVGWEIFAVHNDLVYHLHINPLGFDGVSNDLAVAWETVLNSFIFLP